MPAPTRTVSTADLRSGDTLIGEDPEGAQLPVRVVEVREDSVVIDANHPLAGEVLHYHVAIREVRPATAEELEHGHAHGPDGHDHHHHHDHDH